MNCPGGILYYKTNQHSYRELPKRVGEFGIVHRHELHGALHGLFRVRVFTQDDAHIFMTQDQMKDEVIKTMEMYRKLYSVFGLEYHVELSTRPENSMGSEELWEISTNALRDAVEAAGVPYVINEGDGAFYGPKLDFPHKHDHRPLPSVSTFSAVGILCFLNVCCFGSPVLTAIFQQYSSGRSGRVSSAGYQWALTAT